MKIASFSKYGTIGTMDWQKLKEPSFVVGAATFLLLLVLLFLRGGSSSVIPAARSEPQQSSEFDEALSLTQVHLKNQEFDSAFDMILVASRVSPSDPRLFGLVMDFVEQVKGSENDEVIALAEDLLDRGDSLVHFQNPKNVQSSRKRLMEMRKAFSKPSPQPVPGSAFESARTLLKVSENTSMPLGVRSKAADQARNALDDALLDLAVSSEGHPDKLQSDEIRQLQAEIELAEKQCVTALFLESKPSAEKWISDATSLQEKSKDVASEAVAARSKQISDVLSQGLNHLQEIMPYSKSGVADASELSHRIEKQIKSLQRLKAWLYNQQVLRLIREIESKNELSPEDKISQLAEVSDELLSPYVMRRHNELWEKVFESLGGEDKKAWAVKLRVLRVNE